MAAYLGALDQGTTSTRLWCSITPGASLRRPKKSTSRFILLPGAWNTIQKKSGGARKT